MFRLKEYNVNKITNDTSMSDKIREALIQALVMLFRPLARFALRHGLSFRACSDLLKWCFVDVAHREFGVDGKPNSKSRIAVITGITRVEVDRVLKLPSPAEISREEKYNRATRVLTGWAEDAAFLDENGKPLVLPFSAEKGKPSIESLVYHYSGGTPARPVLDELIRVGCVREVAAKQYELVKRYYVPVSEEGLAEKMHILGFSVQMLMETLSHNLEPGQSKPRFQRIVLRRDLGLEQLEAAEQLLREQAQRFADDTDHKLTKMPSTSQTETATAGIGIYYFQYPNHSDSEGGSS